MKFTVSGSMKSARSPPISAVFAVPDPYKGRALRYEGDRSATGPERQVSSHGAISFATRRISRLRHFTRRGRRHRGRPRLVVHRSARHIRAAGERLSTTVTARFVDRGRYCVPGDKKARCGSADDLAGPPASTPWYSTRRVAPTADESPRWPTHAGNGLISDEREDRIMAAAGPDEAGTTDNRDARGDREGRRRDLRPRQS